MIRKLLLLIAVLFFCQPLAAQIVDYDGLRFTALPDLPAQNFFGHVLMRVNVRNNSGRDRHIRFFMRADYSRELEEVSKNFVVGSGEMREESMLMPIIDFSSSGLEIEVDGVRVLDNYLKKHFRMYRNTYVQRQLLVDSKVSRDEFNLAFDIAGKSARRNEYEMTQFDGNVGQLYRTWLGYSQFNGLIYHADTVEKMPAPVQNAVFDYVRAGGAIIVIGKIDLPQDFVKYHEKQDKIKFGSEYYRSGFGRVIFTGSDFFTRLEASGSKIPNVIPEPFTSTGFKYDRPPNFEDTEIETVSARWLMILIYLFAFLIGPVNVFILHHMGRKILVFLTVPVASFICCIMIYGYYIIFESSVLKIKERSLTLLDERYNRAISLAYYGVYSSSSRSEGLKFDMDTEIFAMGFNDYRNNDAGRFISLDEKQHLSNGWIKPKVPRYVHLRSIQTRRERINLIRTGSEIELLNGLGADIDEIMVRDFDGSCYSARTVRSGARASLKKETVKEAKNIAPIDVFNSGWYAQAINMKKDPGRYLEPGQYLASVKKSPFFSQSFEKDAEINASSLILGVMKVEAEQ